MFVYIYIYIYIYMYKYLCVCVGKPNLSKWNFKFFGFGEPPFIITHFLENNEASIGAQLHGNE